MRVVLDLESNSLTNPTKIHLVVCKDIDTGVLYKFRNITEDDEALSSFTNFSNAVDLYVGHNILDYDIPVIRSLVSESKLSRRRLEDVRAIDTLVVSRLVEYSRPGGHSLAQYGLEFGLPKLENKATSFFSHWSQELEDYCVRDVEITHKVYSHYLHNISDNKWGPAILLEHQFQQVVNALHNNGFGFNTANARLLLDKVTTELSHLDKEIMDAFPARLKLVREISPRYTQYGTLNRSDFRWLKSDDLSEFNGGPFSRCSWQAFNPSSHKQIVDVLNKAGWIPTDKTTTHIATERDLARLRYSKSSSNDLQLKELQCKLEGLKKTGFKINEKNLETLPASAPSPAKTLARRILYEARRRTLTEWLGLVSPQNRIHGKFIGIGAWTHRMAHQEPNTANIPNPTNINGTKKLLGKELRALWIAPKKRLLVGVDAEGIQLRIFAHYIDDKEFTEALVNGRKDTKTDPHSLNARVLGPACRSRAAAKRFIYALLLGAGIGKLTEILECSQEEAREALDRLIQRYSGFSYLKREVIPADAKRGYFTGLDGRKVRIPGNTASERGHLCMSGYLQNGEAIIMKKACLKWHGKLKEFDAMLVNFVHDEWQTEVPNDMQVALRVAEVQALSLKEVGEDLKLNCPLAGSYYNDDIKDYTIGTTWYATH